MTAPHDHAERLSAFVDGEMAAAEVDALLDSLENPACRDQLARFARQRQKATPCVDISAAVAQRIRQECAAASVPSAGTVVSWKPLWRPFQWMASGRTAVIATGFAAAASVAVVALTLTPAVLEQQQTPVADIAQSDAPVSSVPIASNSLTRGAQPLPVQLVAQTTGAPQQTAPRELVIPAPAEQNDLDQLYLQHARFRGGYALAAPVSYGRVGATMVAVPVEQNVEPAQR